MMGYTGIATDYWTFFKYIYTVASQMKLHNRDFNFQMKSFMCTWFLKDLFLDIKKNFPLFWTFSSSICIRVYPLTMRKYYMQQEHCRYIYKKKKKPLNLN